mmetsp:Transcript_11345/g.42543  ORF Transcript_11345/g.42543 Transcript_11345/m.42543 type:complete len:1214 (-) Transcript_11345:127-3768(-)|eukprot:CAMPEP_0117438938 /NCGR_PEP_ID=MMETSP0759-20121206/2313_1 /TAXON_ID=63605 /ORGANISM="Percolomonas cosmopolitus, Strain WS" /LENGTH=1213 /DNA_ID=CAMNT_0005230649 /DNA_START=172 /DNA_END=3813 /DNA_ORIENTATION=-
MKAPDSQFDEIPAQCTTKSATAHLQHVSTNLDSLSKQANTPETLREKYRTLLMQNKFYAEALDLWVSLNEEKQDHLVSILKKHNMQMQKYQMYRERVKLREGTYRSIMREFFSMVHERNVTNTKLEELYNSIETLWEGAQESACSVKLKERMTESTNMLVENDMGFLARAIQERHDRMEMQIKKKSGLESAEAQRELNGIIEKNVRLTSQLQFSQMVEKQNLANVFRGEFVSDLLLDEAEVDQLLFQAHSQERQMQDKIIERLRERKKLAQQMRKRKQLNVARSPKQRLYSAKKSEGDTSRDASQKDQSIRPNGARSLDSTTWRNPVPSPNSKQINGGYGGAEAENKFLNGDNPRSTTNTTKSVSRASSGNNLSTSSFHHNGGGGSGRTSRTMSPTESKKGKHLSPKSPKTPSMSPRTPKSARRRSVRSSRRQTPDLDSLEEYDVDVSLNNGDFEEELALHLWDYQHDVNAQRDEAEQRLHSMEEEIVRQEVSLLQEQDKLHNMQTHNVNAHRSLLQQMSDLERNDMEGDEKRDHIRNVTMQLLQNKREKNNISTTVRNSVNQQQDKLRGIKDEYNRLKKQISVLNERAKVYEVAQPSETEAEVSFKKLQTAADSNFVVCFTDIQSSTSLWEHSTDDMALALQMHDKVIREILAETNGVELKVVGDAFVIVWLGDDCHKAIQAAINMQLRLLRVDWPASIYEHASGKKEYDGDGRLIYSGLRVRVALHFGKCVLTRDPMTNRPDLFGSTMNEGARIEPKCEGGEIIISKQLLEKLQRTQHDSEGLDQHHDYATKKLGSYQMKGLKNEMELHRVIPKRVGNRFFSGQRLQPMLDHHHEYDKLKNELLDLMDMMTVQFSNVEESLKEKEQQIALLERQLEMLLSSIGQHNNGGEMRSRSNSLAVSEISVAALQKSDSRVGSAVSGKNDASEHALTRHSSLANLFFMQKKLWSQYKRYRPKELELEAHLQSGEQSSPVQSPMYHHNLGEHVFGVHGTSNEGSSPGSAANSSQPFKFPTFMYNAHQSLSNSIRTLRKSNQQLTEEKETIIELLRKSRTELDQLRQAFASYKYQQEEVSRRTVDEKTPQTPIDRKALKNSSPLVSVSPAFRKKERALQERVSSSLRMSFDLMMKTKSPTSGIATKHKRQRTVSPLRRPSLFNRPIDETEYLADLGDESVSLKGLGSSREAGRLILLASGAPVVSGNGSGRRVMRKLGD